MNSIHSKINILLVEIVNRNFGDTVIADNTYALLQRALPRSSREQYVIHHYNFYSEDDAMISAADLIVFDGGGIIKFKREKFYFYIAHILEKAQERNIPVYFSGVGVEGYDETDERCQMLKKALRYPCVKGISVRDDLDTLKTCYLEGLDTPCYQVCDPAVYTQTVYDISKSADSNIIGLGIVRHRIFEDHDFPQITREFQLDMWCSLIRELESRGYGWKLFVNGLKSDFDFALEVLDAMGKSAEKDRYLVPRPTESRELVETIASFRGVVACRMHANIIAYSLGIPSVGLVWNDKLTFWGKSIGYPERFLTTEHFTAKEIADCLESSLKQGVRQKGWFFRNSVYRPLKRFVRRYGKAAEKAKGDIAPVHQWNDRLLAPALGSYRLQYSGMNSLVTLQETLDGGFQYLEADVRLTTDGKAVCVNGWSDKTYEKLGIPPGTYDKTGMPYEAFLQCRYYDGHYPVTDLETLLETLKPGKKRRLILDIGKPSKELIPQYASILGDLFKRFPDCWKFCMVRLQTRYDVECFRDTGLPFSLMFYYPHRETREKYNITVKSVSNFCKKQKISWVSIPWEAYDRETALELSASSLKICVFSCRTASEIFTALEQGASLIGSPYLSVKQMSLLFP